jgi:hypothetical protein
MDLVVIARRPAAALAFEQTSGELSRLVKQAVVA